MPALLLTYVYLTVNGAVHVQVFRCNDKNYCFLLSNQYSYLTCGNPSLMEEEVMVFYLHYS